MDASGQSQPNSTPTVSVIIPAYNAAAYIRDTLDSVFAQTYKNFEVILMNDGSPDAEEFESAIEPYRERIVYLKQENRGPSAARNAGILRAQGEYLAFLDSDDAWLPEYLAFQMKLFEGTPSLDMVYCDSLNFGDPRVAGTTFMRTNPSDGPVTFESLLTERCSVITSCTVVRRRIIVECGLFEEQMWRGEDYHMWLRVAGHGGRIAYHKVVLGRRRVHPGALSAAVIEFFSASIAVLKHLESTLELSAERRSLLQTQVAKFQAEAQLEQGKHHLSAGQLDEARHLLSKANAYFRSPKVSLALVGLRFAPRLTRLGARLWEKRVHEP